ncbi:MAG TPA: aconitate hydratase, partial [Candidatus Marinimicrobia bacterium]|nr:aconitate hydratase [Candidatus Neomarinimicrobiota bacterium]
MIDIEKIKNIYSKLGNRITQTRHALQRPLTLSEKILYSHLASDTKPTDFERGRTYVDFYLDLVAMQDATAQMALLQFMQTGRDRVAVQTTVHCDHLIQARLGAETDLQEAKESNQEVYDFLESVSKKYGIGFWKPGAGIIHQVILENYA